MPDKITKFDKLTLIAIFVCIMTVISVVVGVMLKYYTGLSKQWVYLLSAFISMSVFLCIVIFGWLYGISTSSKNFNAIIVGGFPLVVLSIVFGIGFLLTGMMSLFTGHSTDSVSYVITAVVMVAFIIFLLFSVWLYSTL